MSSIQVTLPDGSVRKFDRPITPLEVASSIGSRLADATIGAKVDEKEVDVYFPITKDAKLVLITRESKPGLEILRHSTAHLLAQAVKELYPGTQITIGPVIEEGFYYDIDCPQTLTHDDLAKIEKKMEEIASKKLEVKRHEFEKDEAIKLFSGIGDHYKVELINSFPPGDTISAYRQGDFIDLCRGPHVPNTSKLGKFKLLSLAGAYWRGNENNKMLQRIYGTAFASQKELDEYLHRLEEAKKRDHRKLGPEIGLFTFLPVAPAMPFYLPKGTLLFNMLADFMRRETAAQGYQEVICPQLMGNQLWKTSGHWDNYRDNMFVIEDKEAEEQAMGLKPMNCPGHATLFGSTKHSYRELPIRFSEFTRLHRNERAGVTHGLFRTRAFSQDDAHVFCTDDQIQSECLAMVQHVYRIYELFGFDKVIVRLATRPEKYLGTIEQWDRSEKDLAEALKRAGKEFEITPGEGAFYGPKIEFHIRDTIGRFWQCGTVQLDRNLPERFQLEYVDSDGAAKQPLMIHRAILGSLERFMGILIEHHAGHLPVWISPVQAVIINVTDAQLPYAKEIHEKMLSWGVRAELDSRNEKLGYRIREAQVKRTPMMIVIGNKEVDSQMVSVRKHTGETLNDLTIEGFRAFLEPQLKPGGINH